MPRCVLRSLDCRPNTDTKAITRSTSYAPRAGAACRVKIGTLHQPNHAGVAELADAQDLKSWVPQGACGFNPRPRHSIVKDFATWASTTRESVERSMLDSTDSLLIGPARWGEPFELALAPTLHLLLRLVPPVQLF